MFKPYDLFFEKKFPNEENAESHEEATRLWNNLDAKKKLKFIKKAEKKYDQHLEENPDTPPLYTFLSAKELELLLKSYGLPDKLQINSKLYYIKKKQDEAQGNLHDDQKLDDALKNAKSEAENEYNKFSDDDKNKLLDEYHLKHEEFNDKFFDFARNLPETRIVDYKEFLKRKPEATKRQPQKREVVEKPNKKFSPFEVFLEKHRSEFDQTDNFKARNEARSKFKEFSDKKRLKYIKKAEANYDEYHLSSNEEKPLFSSFLNKNELKLLLESYGMPDSVPNSFSAFYYQKKTKEGMLSMKEAFDSLKQLSAEEKEKLHQEHTALYEDYVVRNKQFMDSLPLARLEDYKTTTSKTKQSTKNRKSWVPKDSPRKKLKKENGDENGKVTDITADESDE